MNIKQKLYSLGAIAILGIIVLMASTFHFSRTTDQLSQAKLLVAELEIRLLNLRRNEKDFLLRSDSKYLGRFNDNMTLFLQTESELASLLKQHDLPSSAKLREDILAYQKGFQNLVAGFETFGLDDKSNLLGAFNAELEKLRPSLNSGQLIALAEFSDLAVGGS